MRILTLTNSPLDSRLGSGKTVLNFSQGLRDADHHVDVFTAQDFRLWPHIARPNQLLMAAGAHQLVRQKMRANSYDLLEFYGGEFGFTTWSYSRRRHRPLLVAHTNGLELVGVERGNAWETSKDEPHFRLNLEEIYYKLAWLSFERADAFVCLCETDRQYVLQRGFYSENRAVVIEPGLDDSYLAIPFDTPREERVAFTGSWIPRKGTNILCRVMSQIMQRRPTLWLDIYGTSGEPDVIRKEFTSSVRSRVLVHPRLSETELATGLSRAKVFFFPTQYEGFGIALAEAMACGCVPVTTRTGFGAELCDAKEAILVDFGDEKAMGEAIDSLLANDGLRQQIAEGAWQRTRSLTWKENARKLADTYSTWIAQKVNNSHR